MAKGRKPRPTYLKLAKGTAKKSRLNKAEPDQHEQPMACPAWLPKGAVPHFERIRGLMGDWGLDSASYQDVVAEVALRIDEAERLTRWIEKNGRGFWSETKTGRIRRAFPEVAMRNEALRHLQSLLAELGLSPTAKARVAGKPRVKGTGFDDV